MADRQQLHEMRLRAHNAGIEGNSKMTADQLRDALKKSSKGIQPQQAKQAAKR